MLRGRQTQKQRFRRFCRERGIPLALLPGDDQPDAELARLSTLPGEACHRIWQFCVHGGPENARNLLAYGAHFEPGSRAGAQTADQAYAGYSQGGYRVATAWRLNSGNFEHEQDAQVAFYKMVHAG